MNWGNHYEHENINGSNPDASGDDCGVLLTGALVLAGCIFFASFLPAPLFAVSLSSLLQTGAIAFALAALWREHFVFGPHFTYWDVTALYHALSIACGWLVDPEAVRAAIEAHDQLAIPTAQLPNSGTFGSDL